MKSKKMQFSMLMFVGFISYSLMFNQVVPFLIEMGYDASQRSIILASFALIAMLGQMLVGYLSDKYGSIKRFYIYLTWVFIATGVLSYGVGTNNFWYHLMLVSSMTALTRIQCNILETWVLQVDGLYHEFGAIRAFGSIGWAVASFISGWMVINFGFVSLGIVNVVINVALIFYSFKLEDIKRVSHEAVNAKDVLELVKNKNFILLLFIFLIVFFVYNVDTILVTERIYEMGGNAQHTGTRGFIHAIVEVPMMFVVGRILIRYKSKKTLIFGTLSLMLKFILFGLATTITQLNVVTILQMVSFPLILIAQRDMINHEVPERLRTTGQMVTSAVTSGFSAILSPLLAASLTLRMGSVLALIVIGLSLIIPVILTVLYKPR